MTTTRCWGKGPPASQPLMNSHFRRDKTLMMYHLSFCPLMGNRDRYQRRSTSMNFKKKNLWLKSGGFVFSFCLWAQKHCLFSSLNLKGLGNKERLLSNVVIWSLSAVSAAPGEMRKVTSCVTQNNLILCLALLPCWPNIFLVYCTVSAILPTGQARDRVQDPALTGN